MADAIAVRSGSSKMVKTGRRSLDRFNQEFQDCYAEPLCIAHLNMINRKKTQFVGVKALNCSLRYLAKAVSNKTLY